MALAAPAISASLTVTVLGSGSSGNAILLRSATSTILVDAGLSARRLCQRLQACGVGLPALDGILITHEHGDHTGGLKVLHRQRPVPLYANALTAEAIRFAAKEPLGPWQVFSTGRTFTVGDFQVRSFSVPHDAADPVGLVIETRGTRFAVLTDLGKVTQGVVEAVRGVHGLFLETNYDDHLLEKDEKRPWSIKQRIRSPHGHLSNAAAADLVARAATPALQTVVLGHLSEDCNSPALACQCVSDALAPTPAAQATVLCAPRDTCSPCLEFFPLAP